MPQGSTAADAVAWAAALPGITDQVESARDACARLRWHPLFRGRVSRVPRSAWAAAAESRVRGAVASAGLEGAVVPPVLVRDVLRGARSWATEPGPVEQVARGVVAATAESEHLVERVLRAPRHVLARLHTLAAAGLVPDAELGRPRLAGEDCLELGELGPAPPAGEAGARLDAVVDVLTALPRLPVVVAAAVVHAEIVHARPFLRANGVVARALDRVVVQAGGLDPTGVVVTEAGHSAGGSAAYLGALAAYGRGDGAGLEVWIEHCCEAVRAGAADGGRIADAIAAGRLD